MIHIPKGTKDVLPAESYRWHYVENKAREVALRFGLSEARTPAFEHTELFLRGVGETTDIVNKEMYTFLDKGERSITLKPEGTAGIARAYVENNLGALPAPTKMYYITPVFRYERPQSGRLREHHQFGVELYGSELPYADAEAILVAKTLFDELGIKDLELHINSIGCPNCRKKYNEALRIFLTEHESELCPTCLTRMAKNPLRVLDCKVESCKKVTVDAPVALDYLCDECKAHFETLQKILESVGLPFRVDPKIVRGLDYYTRTVFEFISTNIGAQGTVCGGGRYNHLVEEVGGAPTPAAGFGMGLERLLMVMDANGIEIPDTEIPLIYIAPLGEEQRIAAFKITNALRKDGIAADTDLVGRSLKAQMKYANKKGYRYTAVLGESELESGKIKIKNMADGSEREMEISRIAEEIKSKEA